MTPLKKYRLVRFIKYSSIVLLIFFIISIPISLHPLKIFPFEVKRASDLGFSLLKTIGWIPSIIMFSIFWLLFTKLDQHLAGYKGEALGQKELKKLKKHGYKVFANMKLKHNNDQSEMDFIVIGSNGIFIVEVKNIKGTITGHVGDEHLIQIKKTKYNTYENKFYNPIKQVNTHVYKLSKYLKDNNINDWIEGYVYFPKKHSSIQVENNERIYSKKGTYSLLKHIRSYQSKEQISTQKQARITELIGKYAVKI
jgi:hypothetical protein